MPAFIVVGLPDKAVAESRERVRAVLSAIGLSLPPKRITVNLSPADLPKEGSHYDLPIALALLGAMGLAAVMQGSEAAWAGEIDVLAAPDLLSLLNHLKGQSLLTAPVPISADAPIITADLKQVKGQESAKRALEIAAAGGHNLLMSGPPGSGKSLMASCLPGILPPLSPAEAFDIM